MFPPNIDVKLTPALVVAASGFVFSYFTNIGWWAVATISIALTAVVKSNWAFLWAILSAVSIVLGIWKIGWLFF